MGIIKRIQIVISAIDKYQSESQKNVPLPESYEDKGSVSARSLVGLDVFAGYLLFPVFLEKYFSEPSEFSSPKDIYKSLFQKWFEYQKKLLKEKVLLGIYEENFIEYCWVYTRAVALKFKEINVTEISFEDDFSFEDDEFEKWERFFGADDLTHLMGLACPWKAKKGYLLSLYDKGVVDYFADLTEYDLKKYLDLSFARGDEGVEELSEILNREILTVNNNQLHHLVADIFTGDISKEDYFRLVSLSGIKEKFVRIATNAMTILNYARVSFSGMDLSGIKIPRACLKGAILHSTKLISADLTDVDLQNAFLCQTIFTGSQMSGISLGEKIMKIPIDVECVCLDEKRNILIMKGAASHFVEIAFFELSTQSFIGILNTKNIEFESKLAFSQDKKWLAFGSNTETLEILSVEDSRNSVLLTTLKEIAGTIISISFSEDAEYLAIATKTSAIRILRVTGTFEKVWDVPIESHPTAVTSLAFISQHFLVLGDIQGSMKLFEIKPNSYEKLWEVKNNALSIDCIAFCEINQLVACGSNNGEIYIWEWRKNELLRVLKDNKYGSLGMKFSNNGQYFASASPDATIRLWDLNEPRESPVIFSGHSAKVNIVIFISNDKFLLSRSSDLTIRYWNLKEKNIHHSEEINSSHFPAVISYRPNSNNLFSSNGNEVQVWNTRSLSVQRTLQCCEDLIARTEFSWNGRYLPYRNGMDYPLIVLTIF